MTSALIHDTLQYGSDDEYVRALAPFLEEGLDAGEGVVVATHLGNQQLLADALGARADDVLFVSAEELYSSPHAAIRGYDDVLAMFERFGRTRVRAIGEVAYPDELTEEWLRYEPLAHLTFLGSPLHVICPYDERRLPTDLLEHARLTHPTFATTDGSAENPRFRSPTEILDELKPEVAPSAPAQIVPLNAGVAHARRAIAGILCETLRSERLADALIAIGEVLANAQRHGEGEGRAEVAIEPELVHCVVRNPGAAIQDPIAGYRPPRRGAKGYGLWVARQLADGFSVSADHNGPVVALAFRR